MKRHKLLIAALLTISNWHAQSVAIGADHFQNSQGQEPLEVSHARICARIDTSGTAFSDSLFFEIHSSLDDTVRSQPLGRGFRMFHIKSGYTFGDAYTDLDSNTSVQRICASYLTVDSFDLGVTDLVSVQFKDGIGRDSCLNVLTSFGLNLVDTSAYLHGRWEVALDDTVTADAVEMGNELHWMPEVEWACASFFARAMRLGGTFDPYFKYQYYLKDTSLDGGYVDVDIDVELAWRFALKDQDFRIAILDDGIAPHPDLPASRIRSDLGWDFVGPLQSIRDNGDSVSTPGECSNHGMACAGILGASHNEVGIMGVFGTCTIIPIKIFDDFGDAIQDGETSINVSAQAILHAYAAGARIISNSWGYRTAVQFPQIESALLHVVYGCVFEEPPGAGAVPIFASGNEAQLSIPVVYPANSSYAIAVGSLDKSNSRWDYSCYGSALDIMAPAGDVIEFSSLQSAPCTEPALEGIGRAESMSAAIPNSGGDMWTIDQEGALGWHRTAGEGDFGDIDYTSGMGGTSGACPQVAGVAGLVLARRPDFPECYPFDIVYEVLTGSAVDIGPSGWDSQTGYGRLNAYRAMLAVARCDANGDALYDLADVIEAIHQADASLAPLIHKGLSDLNCDGVVDGDDVTLALDIVFNDASWPDPCFEFDY